MANPEDIKKATRLQNYMPFSVVPDKQGFGIGEGNYGQEKNIANAEAISNGGLYSYGGKMSGPFAPGTKTLGAKQFDEEMAFNKDKFAYGVQQDQIANQIAMAKALKSGSGSSSSSIKAGNPQAFADAIKGMNQGHTWWQQAQDSENATRTPQDYAPYINEQLTYGERTQMPLSEAEIKALQEYAEKLRVAEAAILKGFKTSGSDLSSIEAALRGE